MFGNGETLVKQLGDEIILGMDIFDVNDIWDVLHNESLESLNAIADQVRLYVIKNYKEGLCWSISFLEEQIRYWVLQFTWRYRMPSTGASAPVWRRIRKGERLPCNAYVWHIGFEKNPGCWDGKLIPNVAGILVGADSWYLPAQDVHDLPKENY